MTRTLVSLLVALCVLQAGSAHSGGGFACFGCATEATQALNNLQLYAKVQEQIKTVEQLITTYKTKYLQLIELVNAGKQITSVSVGDLLAIKRELDAYQNALKTLKADLGSMQGVFDTRMTEANLLKLSPEDYFAREAKRIANNNSVAKVRLANEVQLVEQVKKDMVLAETYSKRIAATEGVHQSSQLLNYQMNLAAQQLTRLVQMTAQQQGSEIADKMNERAAKNAAITQINQGIGAAQRAVEQRNTTIINGYPPRGD